ncbi:uncharacterized protein LOC114517354 [Dendronephthya gigantea]|uniref:uncharacterized protein LOC114517354 n=1 Tax=Dendronephthya gigantea TaxID=151771 RepID=UPI00106BB4D7|nr:uncharacterized protein LOC114517354 [Dendronephthya gigantea]
MQPLKLVAVVLKIAEIVFLLAGTGVVGYFIKEYYDDTKKLKYGYDRRDIGGLERYEFYLYTTVIGIIFAIISFVALILGRLEKKNSGILAMVAVHALWALQLVVATALLAKILTTFEEVKTIIGLRVVEKSLCDSLDESEKDYQCSHLIGGVVCGFFAFILFCIDTVVYIIWCNKSTA